METGKIKYKEEAARLCRVLDIAIDTFTIAVAMKKGTLTAAEAQGLRNLMRSNEMQ
ncbi:hypothetical protein [uncultured Flavobacterium sp.]|uniref:hypothetical protein n=1 Tax=uncultured Flavobacterium sp. TaxID=165435 RepID=UPI0025E8877E|nr:hypothetical protein [uncultured Flavobacterium sp.]